MSSQRRFPRIMSQDELNKVIDTIKTSPHYLANRSGELLRWRDATAVLLMLTCGLRPKECLTLKWADIDFEKREIYISPTSNKERNDLKAVLTLPAINILEKYKTFLDNFKAPTSYLFPSILSWQPVDTQTFGKRLLKIMREAGIAKIMYYSSCGRPVYNFKPYTLRHNFCTEVYKKTGDTTSVTALARHTSPQSAFTYIHLNKEDKQNIADKVFN